MALVHLRGHEGCTENVRFLSSPKWLLNLGNSRSQHLTKRVRKRGEQGLVKLLPLSPEKLASFLLRPLNPQLIIKWTQSWILDVSAPDTKKHKHITSLPCSWGKSGCVPWHIQLHFSQLWQLPLKRPSTAPYLSLALTPHWSPTGNASCPNFQRATVWCPVVSPCIYVTGPLLRVPCYLPALLIANLLSDHSAQQELDSKMLTEWPRSWKGDFLWDRLTLTPGQQWGRQCVRSQTPLSDTAALSDRPWYVYICARVHMCTCTHMHALKSFPICPLQDTA